jgi:ribosomal protein S12 methylthiotransferase accessory factor
MSAIALFNLGTQRLCSPEETLRRVAPHRLACGITRSTSVTGLDTLGVPSWCAIRPDGRLLQVSNGKGLSPAAAEASAVMEALELFHAEHPLPERLLRVSAGELRGDRQRILSPERIPGFRGGYWSEQFRCDWVRGEDLVNGEPVYVPASAVYFFRTPSLHLTSTNGLASGNHPAEASLHALYELIERDAMSRLSVDGKLRIRERARVVDPDSVDTPEMRALLDRARDDHTRVVLLWLESAVPLHTFWAVFLSARSFVSTSTFNVGWGTHVDRRIAAARALTEAAQSRVTSIHGAREDIREKPVFGASAVQCSPAYRYFEQLRPDTRWEDLDPSGLPVESDLDAALAMLVNALADAGHQPLVRIDLTRPGMDIPVVKVIAPTLRFNHRLF